MVEVELGVIGGSGLYQMEGLRDVETMTLDTPFGKPSDDIVVGSLHGRRVAFLPRHGQGHTLAPNEVPYRANILALKMLGAKYIVSISACGSLREDYEPGHIVIPDQLFDFTRARERSFFGDGLVAHVSVADPFSPELSAVLGKAVQQVGGTVHDSGTFITIEGPRFSSRGESNTYRQWGMSIIGMTTSPEAFLAVEAEIAYAVMAHVTDYDVWHESEKPVTVEMVMRTLQRNTEVAKKAIAALVANMDDWQGEFPVHHSLRDAVLTSRNHISQSALDRLDLLVGKYM